jgi:hypothetical protein
MRKLIFQDLTPFGLAVALVFLGLLLLPSEIVQAQAYKCVVDGKTLYTDSPCPKGAKIQTQSSQGASSAAGAMPTVPNGLWKIRGNINGTDSESEICGNPLNRILESIQPAQSLGCTNQITSPRPNTTKLIVDCAADRAAADGSARVSKGRTEVTIILRSPQSFTMEAIRSGGSYRETADATRVV